MDYCLIKEKVMWLESDDENQNLDGKVLSSWLKCGRCLRKETRFCDKEIIESLFSIKTFFDKIDPTEFTIARSICNPFETIGRSIFQNRSAVKMVDLDALLDRMFTNPKSENEVIKIDFILRIYLVDQADFPNIFCGVQLKKLEDSALRCEII